MDQINVKRCILDLDLLLLNINFQVQMSSSLLGPSFPLISEVGWHQLMLHVLQRVFTRFQILEDFQRDLSKEHLLYALSEFSVGQLSSMRELVNAWAAVLSPSFLNPCSTPPLFLNFLKGSLTTAVLCSRHFIEGLG